MSLYVNVNPKIQDFKVQIHESTILLPIHETQRKTCFLSNLDQDSNFATPIVHFFSANPNFPVEKVVKMLKTAVQKVLVSYECIAGRLRLNQKLGRLEIDCNGAGVGFVVASSEVSLDEIGELVYLNPRNRGLVVERLDNFGPNGNDHPLCIFQVTSFKCGGFSMGFTFNHIYFDGNGAKIFLDNVASQAFEKKPLAVIPCHDRHLLAARFPPHVEFSHPELILIKPSNIQPNNNIQVQEEFVYKIFKLSSKQINYLKDKAKPNTIFETNPKKFSRFSVVAALIWRCKELSTIDVLENDSIIDKDKVWTLNIAVDVRSRLNLPTSYCGNAVTYTYTCSKLLDLEEKPFSEIVGKISDGITGLSGEYVRSTVDWYEINKGRPNQSYFISSWWRIGFEKVVYPWGKPIYILPTNTRNVCILLPSENPNDEGVNAVVTLPPKEMDKFQRLFYDFLKK